MQRAVFIFLFLLIELVPAHAFGSFVVMDSIFVIKGKITDSESNLALKNVSIRVQDGLSGTLSDSNGIFSLALEKGRSFLVFSLIGYEKKYVRVNYGRDVFIEISLKRTIANLAEVVINSSPVETVIKSKRNDVLDYDFYNGEILVITFGNSLKKSKLFLISRSFDTLGRLTIPGEPVRLFKDCLGNNHVVCTDSIYQVNYTGSKKLTLLKPKDIKDFENVLLPCIAKDTGFIYLESKSGAHLVSGMFHGFMSNSHIVTYYSVDKISHRKKELLTVVDERILKMSQEEQSYEDKKEAAGLYQHTPRWADQVFTEQIVFKEIYAPLMSIKDTVYIFDYINSKILRFFSGMKLEKEVPISFHENKSWKRNMCMDEKNGRAFVFFESDGITELKEINLDNGAVIKSKKIPFVFAENIKSWDNYIYFLYKGKEDSDTKFLSRMRLD